jgi:hypothetical protein
MTITLRSFQLIASLVKLFIDLLGIGERFV